MEARRAAPRAARARSVARPRSRRGGGVVVILSCLVASDAVAVVRARALPPGERDRRRVEVSTRWRCATAAPLPKLERRLPFSVAARQSAALVAWQTTRVAAPPSPRRGIGLSSLVPGALLQASGRGPVDAVGADAARLRRPLPRVYEGSDRMIIGPDRMILRLETRERASGARSERCAQRAAHAPSRCHRCTCDATLSVRGRRHHSAGVMLGGLRRRRWLRFAQGRAPFAVGRSCSRTAPAADDARQHANRQRAARAT